MLMSPEECERIKALVDNPNTPIEVLNQELKKLYEKVERNKYEGMERAWVKERDAIPILDFIEKCLTINKKAKENEIITSREILRDIVSNYCQEIEWTPYPKFK
jgi:hypothetical protein